MWSYICALALDHGFFRDEDFKNLASLGVNHPPFFPSEACMAGQ